jgi:hypothetical protein
MRSTAMVATLIDWHQVRRFIEDAAAHYDKTAPQLVEWLDDVYIALAEKPLDVTVFELLQLQQLRLDGVWEQPNYAQNRWYKVRALKGQPNGVLSF